MTTTQTCLGEPKAKAEAARVGGGETAARSWRETIRLWRRALSGPYAQFAWVALANAHPAAPYSR